MLINKFFLVVLRCIFGFLGLNLSEINPAYSYPIFAQQNYKTPREANGRIVCANCHLAQKSVELDVPQAVLPDEVFEVIVEVRHDLSLKQVQRNGKPGELNVGAVLILPDAFKLAPPDRIRQEIQVRVKNLYFQPYRAGQENVLVVGPVPRKKYQQITFPILAPTPGVDKEANYLKYPIYLGGNRGRGQVYPDGSKSNNNVYTASTAGTIKEILPIAKGGFQITLIDKEGTSVNEQVPPGPRILVKVGQSVADNEPLTNNPNVGGFGQSEAEIVLQDPVRIQGLLVFFVVVFLTQVILVLKKKTV
jgi:apocytochrome f